MPINLILLVLSLQQNTVNANTNSHCLVLRKNYWDACYDEKLFEDKVALNLLYAQTASDVERGWLESTKEVRRKLASFQARSAKREVKKEPSILCLTRLICLLIRLCNN